jgi:hypothetical protein
MYIFTPRIRPVSFFVLIYFTLGIFGALTLKNYEFLLYEAQMALIMGILILMDKRVIFSRTVLWLLAIWGLLHLSGGLMPIPESLADASEENAAPVLYNMRLFPWFPRYDQIVHAFGFGVSALAAHQCLEAHFGKKLPISLPIAAILFLVACGLGAVNELIEFAAVKAIPQTNVGGYFNTGWDLVSNATGAIIAIIYLRFCKK